MPDEADVFIDGMFLQNVIAAYSLGSKVDYEKLSNKLAGSYRRNRTYVFDALPHSNEMNQQKKQRFLDKLRYLNSFQVELGYVKLENKHCPKCHQDVQIPRQKKVDILIATRLIERSKQVDKIILVAGDADFVPAIEFARQNSKIAVAYADHASVGAATQLIQACDERIVLDTGYFQDCLLPV